MYVPDQAVLASPGLIGFIAKVAEGVESAAGAVGGAIKAATTPQPGVTPVGVTNVPAAQESPSWLLPAGLVAGGLLLAMAMNRRRS